mmetsp:Transcript_14493/g.39703  ORF Transcript_14493/g.39703 Transcript_14493/m.39703 type:complete len:282 (-) Transcript_14493:236-1081(-)
MLNLRRRRQRSTCRKPALRQTELSLLSRAPTTDNYWAISCWRWQKNHFHMQTRGAEHANLQRVAAMAERHRTHGELDLGMSASGGDFGPLESARHPWDSAGNPRTHKLAMLFHVVDRTCAAHVVTDSGYDECRIIAGVVLRDMLITQQQVLFAAHIALKAAQSEPLGLRQGVLPAELYQTFRLVFKNHLLHALQHCANPWVFDGVRRPVLPRVQGPLQHSYEVAQMVTVLLRRLRIEHCQKLSHVGPNIRQLFTLVDRDTVQDLSNIAQGSQSCLFASEGR